MLRIKHQDLPQKLNLPSAHSCFLQIFSGLKILRQLCGEMFEVKWRDFRSKVEAVAVMWRGFEVMWIDSPLTWMNFTVMWRDFPGMGWYKQEMF